MIKKMMLLATAAAAVMAFAAPNASAWWYHSGSQITVDTTEHFTGSAAFTSGGGGTSCPAITASAIFTKANTIGHAEDFTAVNPATCDVTGGLALIAGGTNSLVATDFTAGTIEHDGKDNINVYDFEFHNTYKSGLKVTLKTTGTNTVTLDADNPSAISHLKVTGHMDSSLGGTVTVEGTLTPTKAGTYGVTP